MCDADYKLYSKFKKEKIYIYNHIQSKCNLLTDKSLLGYQCLYSFLVFGIVLVNVVRVSDLSRHTAPRLNRS